MLAHLYNYTDRIPNLVEHSCNEVGINRRENVSLAS